MFNRYLFLFAVLFAQGSFAAGLEDPKGYAKNSSLQWNWAIGALEKFHWEGNERVLDMGCGDGKITAWIAENMTRGISVGLDLAPAMVLFASETHRDCPNLLFLEGDIADLPFAGQFDLVTAFCSLHYVVEQEEALKSIRQSLKPGGKLLFVGPGRDGTSLGPLSETLIKSDKWASYFPKFERQRVYYTKEEYAALLGKMGFRVESFEVSHDAVRFPDRIALLGWLRPLVNYTAHLPAELREDFLNDLADGMLCFALPSEEGIFLQSTLFECVCEKASD